MSELRVGLVLSGGGAKGAYQVGVVKALADMGAQVDAVAGASIGALNGAIVASAPSLAAAGLRMEQLWCALAAEPPLRHELPAYLKLALAGGMSLSVKNLDVYVEMAYRAVNRPVPEELQRFLSEGLYSSGPLHELMDRYLDPQALQRGLPLYISAYESRGGARDLMAAVAAEAGFGDTRESDFFHVQSLAPAQQREALLASAAIPVIFGARRIGKTTYVDGGLGGWTTAQGNTPIGPLLTAGIRNIVVTHLSDGSLWSRHSFPDSNIIEIRPQTPIARDGGFQDLLGFDQKKIPDWIAQGYTDACACLRRVADATAARGALRSSEEALHAVDSALPGLDAELQDALNRLRPPNWGR